VNPLLTILRDPTRLGHINPAQWDLLLRTARRARLLGHLDRLVREAGLAHTSPPEARVQLEAFGAHAAYLATQARWEIHQVHRVLGPAGVPVMLLKGAAYLKLGLPVAHRRVLSDVDLLVPKEQLRSAEQLLLDAGWEPQKLNPYDQRYYRNWMHELPPLRRRGHSLELDLHHNLLPPSGRLQPDPQRLWREADALGDGLWCPCPTDLLLHSAAHLFEAGDLQGGLRDLVDIQGLLLAFAPQRDFCRNLVPRAQELDLVRPLGYALDCARLLLHAPVPAEMLEALRRAGAHSPTASLTRRLMLRVLAPRAPEQGAPPLASLLLYMRSHWLRMPPSLLLRHLTRKAVRRSTAADGTLPRELM
jgi:hypothetical protein